MDAESQLLADKDGEIARLRIELFDAGEKRIWLTNQIEAQRKLIGELADALEPFALSKRCPEGNQLIQRAREATK